MLLALRGQAELLGSPGEERRELRVYQQLPPSLSHCAYVHSRLAHLSAMWRVTLSKQPDILQSHGMNSDFLSGIPGWDHRQDRRQTVHVDIGPHSALC